MSSRKRQPNTRENDQLTDMCDTSGSESAETSKSLILDTQRDRMNSHCEVEREMEGPCVF